MEFNSGFKGLKYSVLIFVEKNIYIMEHLEGSGTPILYIGCTVLNPLNTELNPICHLLALLGAHHFLHVSRIRLKVNVGSGMRDLRYIITSLYIQIITIVTRTANWHTSKIEFCTKYIECVHSNTVQLHIFHISLSL